MFGYIKEVWDEYGFEIVVISSIIFMVLIFIYRYFKGEKGSYDANRYKRREIPISSTPKRAPPKTSKGEIACKEALHQIFRKPFRKERPHFLKNPVTSDEMNDYNLEIDCYNDELKIGVEYNGVQHYKYTPFFHKNKEAFFNQKYRDEIKRTMCKENNILLIEVPYTVSNDMIYDFILNKLKENNRV